MAQKMEICVMRLLGEKIPLKVDPHETLVNVKILIHENEGIPPDQIRLLFAGKVLNDYDLSGERKTLYHYNIQKESTIHMLLSLRGQSSGHSTEPVSDTSAAESYKAWEAKAKEGDFDQDLHIVDSQSHFHLLKQLERQVVARSEFCQAKGKYDIHKISDPDLISQPQNSLPDLPTWLLEKLDANMPKWKVLVKTETKLEKFQHLWKSYTILSNVSRGITQMMALQFCTDSINILMRHSCKGVIEIKRLDLILIEDIKTSVETTISLILEDLNEDAFINFVRLVGLSPCERLLKHLGYEDIETKTTAPEAALGLLRKTVLLLDMALISYVRSHGSGFDTPGLGSEVKFVEVSEGEDSFAFKCSWMKLTCLAAFLDGRQVWVFEFLNPSPVESHLEQDITPRPTSVLTRMRDLADIWGPVYTVPNASGLVKHYVVSNGVICRVNTKQQCTAPGAVQCHYYSRPSFLRRKAYKLISKEPELLLAEDDVLLIGGGLRENRYCKYKMSDLARDFASDFTVLGTKESVWKTDSRSAAIGVSKFFGITVSGSQKLIPQTTLKQHILDKWTANPLRANPAIFNHYLGV